MNYTLKIEAKRIKGKTASGKDYNFIALKGKNKYGQNCDFIQTKTCEPKISSEGFYEVTVKGDNMWLNRKSKYVSYFIKHYETIKTIEKIEEVKTEEELPF